MTLWSCDNVKSIPYFKNVDIKFKLKRRNLKERPISPYHKPKRKDRTEYKRYSIFIQNTLDQCVMPSGTYVYKITYSYTARERERHGLLFNILVSKLIEQSLTIVYYLTDIY